MEVDPPTRSFVVDDGTGTVTATSRVADGGAETTEVNSNTDVDGLPEAGTACDTHRGCGIPPEHLRPQQLSGMWEPTDSTAGCWLGSYCGKICVWER